MGLPLGDMRVGNAYPVKAGGVEPLPRETGSERQTRTEESEEGHSPNPVERREAKTAQAKVERPKREGAKHQESDLGPKRRRIRGKQSNNEAGPMEVKVDCGETVTEISSTRLAEAECGGRKRGRWQQRHSEPERVGRESTQAADSGQGGKRRRICGKQQDAEIGGHKRCRRKMQRRRTVSP